MRTERESNIVAAFFVVAVLVVAWRFGYNAGRSSVPVVPVATIHRDPCDGENLSYRSDSVAIRTYVGDPGDGVLCAVVPLRLLFTE